MLHDPACLKHTGNCMPQCLTCRSVPAQLGGCLRVKLKSVDTWILTADDVTPQFVTALTQSSCKDAATLVMLMRHRTHMLIDHSYHERV